MDVLGSLQIGYKARETRHTVLIPARMHSGASWSDVVIHNLSANGALIACDDAPERGSYVDIRRGRQTIIGRVVWQKGRFFGIRARETIDINTITNEPRLAGKPKAANKPEAGQERRAHARMNADADVARRLEQSRRRSSALQFMVFAVAAFSIAAFAAVQVKEVLSRPLSRVIDHL